jgi:hypothetical protein
MRDSPRGPHAAFADEAAHGPAKLLDDLGEALRIPAVKRLKAFGIRTFSCQLLLQVLVARVHLQQFFS